MAYKVQSADTSFEAEQLQIEIMRRKGAVGRSELMRSLTRTTRWASWHNLRKLRPALSKLEATLFFLEIQYDAELAGQVRTYLEDRRLAGKPFKEENLLIDEELLAALTPVIITFEELGVTYLIGGSVASSTHGIARSTADADLVANLNESHIQPFISRLQDTYYVSEVAMLEAITRKTSFSVLHLETGLKVDIFSLKDDPFNQTGFGRAMLVALSKTEPRQYRLNSPEDIILQKLNWYLAGGQVSDKQWLDIQGILKMQPSLDWDYLVKWAAYLNVADLLEKARQESSPVG